MSQLTEEDRKAIKKTYRQMDENGDGRVSVQEVKRASKRLGIQFSPEQLKLAMGELDDNGDGYLSYKEFEALVIQQIESEETEYNYARQTFLAMDMNRDGKVTCEEIAKALKISKTEAEDLLKDADTNNDGEMSFEEFYNAFKGTNEQQEK